MKLRERLSTQVLSRPADQGHSVEPIRAGQPARTGRGGCGETGRGSTESGIAPEREATWPVSRLTVRSRDAGFRSDVAHNS